MQPPLISEGEVKEKNFRRFSTSSTDETHMLKLEWQTKWNQKSILLIHNTALHNKQYRSHDLNFPCNTELFQQSDLRSNCLYFLSDWMSNSSCGESSGLRFQLSYPNMLLSYLQTFVRRLRLIWQSIAFYTIISSLGLIFSLSSDHSRFSCFNVIQCIPEIKRKTLMSWYDSSKMALPVGKYNSCSR